MTHEGGCHCGAVRYEVEVDIESLVACNCSICSKRGWLLAFGPESAFELKQGEEALVDYQFGEKHIHHLFCGTCGVGSFGRGTRPDGTKTVAINARCLDGFDVTSVPVHHYDGKAR